MIKLDKPTVKVIADQITFTTGRDFDIQTITSISGGDINAAYRLQSDTRNYFVKLNHVHTLDMFQAEFAGLQALAATQTLLVPTPILCGQTDTASFLVLEYLQLHRGSAQSDRVLGRQLAHLHLQSQPYFGWHRDNTIGLTPQLNSPSNDWIAFWRTSRLEFQLNLIIAQGYGKTLASLGALLSERLAVFFQGYTPSASLLHGDLWSGNAAVIAGNTPVIFDPACYYGDRETDLAMTELFGGFGRDFYAAYNDVWQLDSGYSVRKHLYNLYHILNHTVMFGGGYVSQAEKMMQHLLQEI